MIKLLGQSPLTGSFSNFSMWGEKSQYQPQLSFVPGPQPCLMTNSLHLLSGEQSAGIGTFLRTPLWVDATVYRWAVLLLPCRPNGSDIPSHRMLCWEESDTGTETFMAFPGGAGTQVVFPLPQPSKWRVCLRSPGKSLPQGTESRSPDAQYTITNAENSQGGAPVTGTD